MEISVKQATYSLKAALLTVILVGILPKIHESWSIFSATDGIKTFGSTNPIVAVGKNE